MSLDYNAIEDYKFNPFTKTKYYTTITDESHVIPASPVYGGYLIWLYHAPRETIPTSVSITIGGNPLFEVTAAPGNMQYRVYYDEEGCGCVEFNGNQAGGTALVTYQSYGTFNSKAFAQAVYDAFYSGNSQIFGISMTNNVGDSDHDIDFGSGSAHNTIEKLRIVLSAMTKKLDSVWSIGDTGGMLDTGVIGANADYYIYLIGKNNDPAAGDIVASLNSTLPALPATWTNYTLIGICQTDAASKIRQGQWRRNGNEIEFRYKVFINDRAVAVIPNTDRLLVSLTAPLNSKVKIVFVFWSSDGVVHHFNYGETFETDILPFSLADSRIATLSPAHICEYLKLDSNKQVFIRASSANSYFNGSTLGWKITL